MRAALSALLFLTLSAGGAGAEAPRHCHSEAVRSWERPFDDARPQRGTFRYHVHVNRPAPTDGPAVIFIPGGPGQTGLQTPLSYPDDFRVVRTDPRGLGCNADPRFQDADHGTEQIARDVLSIVRELGLTRYILHGISYGSMVATVAARLSVTEGLPAPAAVVLEGVIGRAFLPGEYDRAYIENWDRLRRKLPPRVQQHLSAPRPLGLHDERWAAWIALLLSSGEFDDGTSLLENQLVTALDGPADSPAARSLVARVENLTRAAPAERARMHRWITCREIAPDMRDLSFDFHLIDGALVANERRLCDGLALSAPFDASAWQSPSPLYYFSGELDPATPPWQARYHFDHQRGPRTLVQVARGAHAALSISLMDCQNRIWESIAAGRDLEPALAGCRMRAQRQSGPRASPGAHTVR